MGILGKTVAATSDTLVYTVPANKKAVLTIAANNLTNTDIVATISVRGQVDYELDSVTIAAPGDSFTVLPDLVVSGGGGNSATAVVTRLQVGTITFANAGQGYNVGNVLTFDSPSGGQQIGYGAAEITVTSVDGNGAVTGFTITDNGTYSDIIYNGGSPLTLTGGTGTLITVDVDALTYGINAISVNAAGYDYTSLPTITAVEPADPTHQIGNASLLAVLVSGSIHWSDAIEYNVTIPATGVLERSGIVLGEGDTITAKCNQADSMNVFVFGIESIA